MKKALIVTMVVVFLCAACAACADGAVTIGAAKQFPNDTEVQISGAVVSAAWNDYFYIEDINRVSGIRVDKQAHGLERNTKVNVVGQMKTDANGERYIHATSLSSVGNGAVKPLGMVNKSLGGSDFGMPAAGEGQRGVTGGVGQNNIGLLVKTTGVSTYIDAQTFTIDDGSGINVRCETPQTVVVNASWQQVAVTGVSSLRKNGNDYERLLKVVSVDPVASNAPAVVFDYVPAYNSFDDLEGRALNVNPSEYNIAVFIYVGGWWTKPNWSPEGRVTPINQDGYWICDITTGGVDQLATRIVAYLIPKSYLPDIGAGEPTLPQGVINNAVASKEVVRDASGFNQMIQFAGYNWIVKHSVNPVGPPEAGNYFSNSADSVWVDENGKLHMKIRQAEGKWYCSEVFCEQSFGYGTYKFTIESDAASLNENVVLGLFLWDDSPEQFNREIDIEFSRWGQPSNSNAQYVVQPWDLPGHLHRFTCPTLTGTTVCSFAWSANSVAFSTLAGQTDISSWTYSGTGIPTPGNEKPRINLWLVGGSLVPPSDNKEVEVVFSNFEFTP